MFTNSTRSPSKRSRNNRRSSTDWTGTMRSQIAGKCAAGLLANVQIPFSYLMFFPRGSSESREIPAKRYQAFHLQTRILAAWAQVKYNSPDRGESPMPISIAQRWIIKNARLRFKEISEPAKGWSRDSVGNPERYKYFDATLANVSADRSGRKSILAQ